MSSVRGSICHQSEGAYVISQREHMSSVRGSICHLDRAMNRVRACYEHPERAWRQSMEKRRAWRQSGMETESMETERAVWRQSERIWRQRQHADTQREGEREREREREREHAL